MSMKEALAPWSPSQALVEDDELALNVYISRSVSRLVHMCLAVARLLCLAGFVCLEVLGVHLLAECPFACLFDCSRVGLNSAPVRWTHWRVMAEACAVPTRAQTWQSPAPPNWAGSRGFLCFLPINCHALLMPCMALSRSLVTLFNNMFKFGT
eukprot:m.386384 g.386384  ORF g.386384 m.386384 type:complete len:153 (+) comp56301_c0_seq3:158-616(+)